MPEEIVAISRRAFLRGGGLVMAGGTLVSLGMAPLSASTPTSGAGALKISTFRALQGQQFQVHPETGDSLVVELTRVRDLSSPVQRSRAVAASKRAQPGLSLGPRMRTKPGKSPVPRTECFSVLFCGSRERVLQQGTYSFEHPELGKLELFIVPMAEGKNTQQYEAIFNHLIV